MKALLATLVFVVSCGTAHVEQKAAVQPAEVPAVAGAEAMKCSSTPEKGSGIDPEFVSNKISQATSCDEASRIASECTAGSSMDIDIAGAAALVCDKMTGPLNKAQGRKKKQKLNRCKSVCNERTDGSMCTSQQAFCRLEVSKEYAALKSREK